MGPMVELVPAPWTSTEVRAGARALMAEVGQGPVSLSREVPGFVLNRMQYALLNECWRLVRDGVVSAQDLDVVMKDGMGMRYAFMGPMETIHLNAEGTQNYCDRYGETIYNVSSDLGPIPTGWKQETEKDKAEVAALEATMCSTVPLEDLYKISDFMEHKAQFIVAHPCNPPYHTPMVELVPAPWTSTEVRAGVRALMAALAKLKRDMEREEAASN